MKKVLMLLVFLLATISCVQREVDDNLLQYRNGIYYMPNEEKPFTGLSILKNESGWIEVKANYKDGVLNGEWMFYYKNGQIDFKGNFKDDKSTGEWIGYYENGQIEEKWNEKDGKKDGEWIGYYKNGQIKSKRYFKDGIIQYETKEN